MFVILTSVVSTYSLAWDSLDLKSSRMAFDS